jgi:hypothetical protein
MGPTNPTLTVIRQMLATLETLTLAGRHHVMNKVLAILSEEVERAVPLAGRRSARVLQEQLELLQHETDRPAPSPSAFAESAKNLLALISPAS